MTHAAGRKRALVGLTATALLGLGLFAPAASAQVGTLTDTIDSTTESVGSTTTKTTDTVKDTVDKTTDTTTTTTGSTTTKVTDTVDSVGSTVDSTTGTKTYEETKTTVKTTTDSTTETLNKTAGTVGSTLEEASGGVVSNPNLNVDNPLGSNKKTKKDGTKTSGPASRKEGSVAGRKAELAAARQARENARNRMASLDATERNARLGPLAAASAVVPQSDSFFSNLAEAAREAAKTLAFPLGLALMVGAFLMVQGRIDRKDAKLALAPIDSEQDLLSFQ